MKALRSVISWMFLYLGPLCLFISAGVFALLIVFSADNIKSTIKQEGTYEKIVPAVLATTQYPSNSEGQLPINEPWVQEAAKRAFPASDLEQKTNAVIDGTFTWLDGKTDQPEFTVDFTSNKQQFGQEVGNYSESRLSGLPRCSLNNIPSSLDVFKLNCLPPGVNTSQSASTVASQIATDQGFLKETVITPDNLTNEATSGLVNGNPFEPLNQGRFLYQNRTLWMWLLPTLAVLLSVAGIALAPNRRKSLARLTRSLFMSGVGMLLFGLLAGLVLNQLTKISNNDRISRDIVNPLLLNFTGQIQKVYIIFAIITLVACLGVFLVRRFWFKPVAAQVSPTITGGRGGI